MQLTEDLLLRISITISLVVDYNAEVDDDDHVKMMAMVSVCLLAKVATPGRQVEFRLWV